MCEIMGKIYENGKKYGRSSGRDTERKSLDKKLFADGRYTLEEISNLCKIPLRKVEKLCVKIAN